MGNNPYIGAKVQKRFQGYGIFTGEVTKALHDAERGWLFHVVYTDGDSEDFDEDELHAVLIAPSVQVTSVMGMAHDERAADTRYNLRKRPRASYANGGRGKQPRRQ